MGWPNGQDNCKISLCQPLDHTLWATDNVGMECIFHKHMKLTEALLQPDGHRNAPKSILESSETFLSDNRAYQQIMPWAVNPAYLLDCLFD